MNLRLYTIALLISALPQFAAAGVTLIREDFVAAERVLPSGDSTIRVKLSKSGKAKFKKLNAGHVNQSVHFEIAGLSGDFKLREPISGDELQMGPFRSDEADRALSAINNK